MLTGALNLNQILFFVYTLFLGSHECLCQMASRSVQRAFAGCRSVTDDAIVTPVAVAGSRVVHSVDS